MRNYSASHRLTRNFSARNLLVLTTVADSLMRIGLITAVATRRKKHIAAAAPAGNFGGAPIFSATVAHAFSAGGVAAGFGS